jgi:hypothetical protein
MFILHFLPDFLINIIVNLILVIGLAGVGVSTAFKYAIKYYPPIIPYRTLIQVASVTILTIGVYLKGGINTEIEWRERVRQVEAQVKQAEEESKQTNQRLEEVKKEKSKIVTQTKVVIQEKIVEKAKIIDAGCTVSPDAINVINQAAKNPEGKK